MTVTQLTRSVWSCWRPPRKSSAVEWVPRYIVIPDDTETPGPFDVDAFPHTPGVMEAWDDPLVRVILMAWGSRLGKTITGLALLTFAAAETPRPSMIGREDKDRVDDLITSQLIPLIEACPVLREQLPPPNRRDPKNGVRLRNMRIRRAYSGSPATMAGFPACYALGSEVSKWSKRSSSEADPIFLFKKRGMGFPTESKYIFESTPGTANRCNITDLCSADGVDIRRREVPCPHCGTYQKLVWGSGKDGEPGVRWEKLPDGRHDVRLAEKSAWYQCVKGCRIESHERAAMLRRGVWLSDGQTVTKRGKIVGKRPECTTVAFGHPVKAPFGSLHSLLISGWGQLAREWLEVKGTREGRREFANQTLGVCWDPQPLQVSASALTDRMGIEAPLRICPPQTLFLTLGSDVGQVGDTHLFFWLVSGWWANAGGQLIDLGIAFGDEEFLQVIRGLSYPVEGTTRSLKPVRSGIDSGSFTHAMYTLTKPLRTLGIWPLKGSSKNEELPFAKNDFPEMYRPGIQAAGLPQRVIAAKRRSRAYDLILPNTQRSQEWLEDRMSGIVKRDAPDFYGIPGDALNGEVLPGTDLTHHLFGDYQDEKGNWKKRYEGQEFRDALRYSVVMAWEYTQNGRLWERPPGSLPVAASPPPRRDSDDERRSRSRNRFRVNRRRSRGDE